jgi:hypothetical protein
MEELVGILKDLEPVMDDTNRNTPSGKTINPAQKPTPKKDLKLGGQEGHKGETHLQDPEPDIKVDITLDKDKYDNDPDWEKIGTIKRQVIDIVTETLVTQYTTDVYRNKLELRKSIRRVPRRRQFAIKFDPI